MELQRDLSEFLSLLLSKKVDFLIVGAHAVAYYGHPRLTGDLDILIRLTEKNVQNVEQVCCDFGFAGPPFIASEFLKPGQIFQLGRVPNRIDILTAITGVSTEDAWTRKVSGKLSHFDVYYISKEDLLVNKRSTGRVKDLADADILLRR
jgi:hypothetical protein